MKQPRNRSAAAKSQRHAPRTADSMARLHELYEFAPVGFLTLDKSGRILDVNDKAARLLAFPAEWLVRRPFIVFIAKNDVRRFLAFLSRSLQVMELHTIEVDLFVSGRLVPVQISLRPLRSSDTVIQHLAIVDLSATKRIEQQLQEALDNWHSLVHNVPDIIMTVDSQGRITFANRSVWGCSSSGLLGMDLQDYVAEKYRPKLQKCIATAFNSKTGSACEAKGTGEESDAWYNFSFAAAKNGSGNGDRKTTTLLIREISEDKRAEEALRSSGQQMREFAARLEAVREEERTRMAREIHDELGQALTILKLDLSWLRQKRPTSERDRRSKLKSVIDQVDQTIERVRAIVSELRPAILDDLGLVAAIEWQLTQFQDRTGIQGFFDCASEKLAVTADVSAALFRVVQEALTNVVRHARASEVRITLKAADGRLSISIADDGKGITKDQINDLRSLGIVGMKERIHRIQGEFNIYSRPGHGTRLDIVVYTPPSSESNGTPSINKTRVLKDD